MKGDTGPDGEDGEDGEDGAAGPQGEPGESGPAPGRDRFVIAFSSDQNLGSSGDKFIGLGNNSGSHGDVGVPLPYGGDITRLVGRSTDVCEGSENIVFTVYKRSITDTTLAQPTSIACTIVAGTLSGKACIFNTAPVPFAETDLVSVRVVNNGCPSPNVSAAVGFASD